MALELHMILPPVRSDVTSDAADASAQSVFTSEGGRLDPGASARQDETEDRRRLMAELDISHVGRSYRFRSYRYDNLDDAVRYARLVKARSSRGLPEDCETFTQAARDDEQPPGASDRKTMALLGVSYVAGRYAYESFRYDRLADALAYARRQQHR
jgi:hypothetical protein